MSDQKQKRLNSKSKSPDGPDLSQPQAGTIYGAYLYWDNVKWASENATVHLGINSGKNYQGNQSIAIGANAGTNSQGNFSVALGSGAGYNLQGNQSIAIGSGAGYSNQFPNAVAIGQYAGNLTQGMNAIAIGTGAGTILQADTAIAVGWNAGQTSQSTSSIAVGQNAGQYLQGVNSVAVGQNAGQYRQGSNSIAIGQNAGQTNQPAHSIVLNATSTAINPTTTGFFISTIQGPRSSSNVLSYDTATNEIFYNGSSERYKYDITALSTDTTAIYKLRPREFKYKLDGAQDIGLIAEEAYECDRAFAYLDKDQLPEGIQWNVITTYLIAEVRKLKMELLELEQQN